MSLTAARAATLADAALVEAANAALQRHDHDEVIVALATLAQRFPDNAAVRKRLATAFNQRGAMRARARDLPGAVADWDQALRLEPDHVDALVNRARVHLGDRRWDEAARLFARAGQLAPNDVEIALELAEARTWIGEPGAEEHLRHAIAHARAAGKPDRLRLAAACAGIDDETQALDFLRQMAGQAPLPLWLETADAWREGASATMAPQVFHAAAARGGEGRDAPSLRAVIASHLALAQVYRDRDEMLATHARFLAGIERLHDEFDDARLRRCAPGLEQVLWTPQGLAYHGLIDRDPLSRYGDWLARATGVLAPWTQQESLRARGERRVGMVMSSALHSTLGRYFGAWIAGLKDRGIDVTVITPGLRGDARARALADSGTRRLDTPGSLDDTARAIHAAGFDLLIYPDALVEARSFVLASLRLAPRQVVGWAHPDTTGLPQVDTYLSCATMEGPDAATHYRERLLLLPGIGTCYPRPPEASAKAPPLPEGHRYLIPHVPPKLHVDFDEVLVEIARRDRHARLLVVGADHPALRARWRARLHAALRAGGADPDAQLHFLPRMPRADFLATCAASAVMLDPPHWSGGANTLDALAMGLPVVTVPGVCMRARQTLGMLDTIGLRGPYVVDNVEAQVEQALTIASDVRLRADLGEDLRTRATALFDDTRALDALAAHIEALLDKVCPR